ncbi:MAG: hypothetical protein ACFE8P_15315, partial [Promethearchaeota archaeon]
MALTELQILEGSFGLIWVVIAMIIGVRIITKAISRSRSELITVGFTWIFMSSAWWGVAVQFITYGFFNYKLSAFQYLFIANVFIPFALICWIYSFCHIINPNLKKNFFLVIVVFFIVWEIFLLFSLFIDTKLVGTIEDIFDSTHSIIQLIFVFTAIIIFLCTGVFFSVKSMKVDDPEIKWKGIFLLIAWISFTIGALLDAALPLTAITLIIVRLILISSSIEFYLGF